MWAASHAYNYSTCLREEENIYIYIFWIFKKSETDRKGKSLEIIPILTAMFWIVAQTGNHSLQLASWTAKEDKQVACEIIL